VCYWYDVQFMKQQTRWQLYVSIISLDIEKILIFSNVFNMYMLREMYGHKYYLLM